MSTSPGPGPVGTDAPPPPRHGITVPIDGFSMAEHRAIFEEIEALGFTDVWSAEVSGADAFTPLVLAAAWAPSLRLGTAIIPAFTRGPAALASQVAALCSAAPGRVAVGIGSSSNVIVEQWNGGRFEHPYQRVRDTLRFLRRALTGEKITDEFDTFAVTNYRLSLPVEEQPPILVAALRPQMLTLAGREGDGAIINWLTPDDVRTVTPVVGEGKEIVARIFVLPTDDRTVLDAVGRRAITSYLTVPVYAKFHEWLGRGDALREMWDAWAAGDRKAATAAVPEAFLEEVVVWGSPADIKAKIARYVENGVTTPIPIVLGSGPAALETIRAIAPAGV